MSAHRPGLRVAAGVDVGRRRLLLSTLAAGVWTLGPAALPAARAQSATAAAPPPPGFGPWLQFAPDGRVTVLTNVAEMGQGTTSVLAQIAAEELDVALAAVRVQPAPLAPEFVNPFIDNYATFGALGFRVGLAVLAPVCAAARQMLVAAAAQQWGVPADQCQTADGEVRHAASQRRLPYAALLPAAAASTPPAKPAVRRPHEWKVLGRAAPRADQPSKADGSAVFGIDVAPPGLLVAAVAHAPTFGGTLEQVDPAPALALAGVRQVVPMAAAVAVVADGYWAAHKGLQALRPRWRAGPNAGLDSDSLRATLRQAVAAGGGQRFPAEYDPRLDGPAVAEALRTAARVVDTTFDVPFLAQAPIEPLNCTAQVAADGATLWLSTQAPLDTRRAVAAALGLPEARVAVHAQLIGGGFGRRLEHDFAVEAARIAQALGPALAGRPVKMIWSRETDLAAGFYRPAAAARVRLALGADGMPQAVAADLAHPSLLDHSGLTNGPPRPPLDWSASMGWAGHGYAIPALDLRWTRVEVGVPCGYWRSVGASQNAFFLEHSIDLAARAAGIDPLAYRRRLLARHPRALAFVDALAAAAGWGGPAAAGRFRGMAISEANGAISGHVVELSVTAPGRFRLEGITAAIDAGVVGNPDAVQAQMMGGTVFGLSAALFGEITLKEGRVQQGNFHDYPLVTLAQVPALRVVVLGNGERAAGIGEEGPATIGPAVANALLAGSGTPVTRLPLARAGWALDPGAPRGPLPDSPRMTV